MKNIELLKKVMTNAGIATDIVDTLLAKPDEEATDEKLLNIPMTHYEGLISPKLKRNFEKEFSENSVSNLLALGKEVLGVELDDFKGDAKAYLSEVKKAYDVILSEEVKKLKDAKAEDTLAQIIKAKSEIETTYKGMLKAEQDKYNRRIAELEKEKQTAAIDSYLTEMNLATQFKTEDGMARIRKFLQSSTFGSGNYKIINGDFVKVDENGDLLLKNGSQISLIDDLKAAGELFEAKAPPQEQQPPESKPPTQNQTDNAFSAMLGDLSKEAAAVFNL